MSGVTIVGTGRYLPGDPIPNDALARVMDTSDEWIQTRTGIRQRHFAADGQGPSDLGIEAAKRALQERRRFSSWEPKCTRDSCPGPTGTSFVRRQWAR
jgi:3-oxoacyl-[acyl-carrier-protein] synthase-3